MVVKLYGYTRSSCTRYVALVLKEKEISFEFYPIDLTKDEHKAPEYLKYQPFGQVPYIDDDGFILYESRAIARYLVKKYPNQGTPDLIPTDSKGEALFEQAASIETFNFNDHARVVTKTLKSLTPDKAKADEYLKKLEASLDVYDSILGKQRYLAGANVTLADLQHLANGSSLFAVGLGEVIEKRSNVARWWWEISQRPAWVAVKDGV